MGETEDKGITDEQRAEVMRLLFDMLREYGVDIEEGTKVFKYTCIGTIGKVTIYFEIEKGFADWAIETSLSLWEGMLASIAEKLNAKGELKGVIEIPTADNHSAALLAYFTTQGMLGKLENAFFELGLESEKVFEGLILTAMKEHPIFGKHFQAVLPNISEDVKALSKSMATERRRFLTSQINRFKHKPQLEKLPELYPMLHKVWQSAKKIYEDNGESETWRGMVCAKYPELTFDDDLLTRVTGKLETLSEDIQAKLAEKDGDHTPHTIALEHAARMCGASPYQYGVRYYNKLKSKKKPELIESD
jgi:hypothetical protein